MEFTVHVGKGATFTPQIRMLLKKLTKLYNKSEREKRSIPANRILKSFLAVHTRLSKQGFEVTLA